MKQKRRREKVEKDGGEQYYKYIWINISKCQQYSYDFGPEDNTKLNLE